MMIEGLDRGSLTLTLYAGECEQIAKYLKYAAQSGADDPQHAETISGLFLASALVCKTYGMVNLDADVQAQLTALTVRVNGETNDGE